MKQQKFVEGKDYYYDKRGFVVLTKEFHLKRGFCCGNNCRHCPYNHVAVQKKSQDSQQKNNG